MKNKEKSLIEDLFSRLKNTELNVSERDNEADVLIQKLVKNQPHSAYYMVQTILIQETAIKKMNEQIEELKKKISLLHPQDFKKKTSFLSNFFKKDSVVSNASSNNDIWKKNPNITESNNTHVPVSPVTTSQNTGFLRNALQTATGVAGGMILGNMLMNLFSHTKTEDEIFDSIHHVSSDELNDHSSNLINYDDNFNNNQFISSENDVSNLDEVNFTNHDGDVTNYDGDVTNYDGDVTNYDGDFNDDNFI